jgi:outer membrane protein TolC
VERALAQLRQQEASIPDLQATLQESLDQLALMTGRVPGALDATLAEPRPLPQLPAVVPVDDAASLIRRRPDVRRAERQLAASSAKIGQALSGYFPQVTLLGGIGMGATSPGDLGSDAVGTVVAPILRWSVFDFGKTRSQVAQARAGNQAYAASYEAKVLAALQDANNALARFGASRRALAMAGDAADAATRSSDLVQQRYRAGATSLIDALDVQRQQLSARDSRTQAQMKLLVDYIGLQKSLGLGWQAPEQAAAR